MEYNPFRPADIEAALGRRYIVGHELGVGGQGMVFKATRTSQPDGSPAYDVVALKLHRNPKQDIRVEREVAAAAAIVHPALARWVEHGECNVAGRHSRYIAWEFVEGDTLEERLKSGPMLESDVLEMGRHVSAAIAAIWSRHIVHGDLKPSNIMLREGGGAVLIDLGAARHLDEDNSPEARKPFGTRGYFSPEQARGEKNLSSASDVFSLGIVMLQALLGRHPTAYSQSDLEHGLRASKIRVAISPALSAALDKMLSEKERFRPAPAELSGYFHRLQERVECAPAVSVRQAPRTSSRR
jgi:serine/threonine protein kinase